MSTRAQSPEVIAAEIAAVMSKNQAFLDVLANAVADRVVAKLGPRMVGELYDAQKLAFRYGVRVADIEAMVEEGMPAHEVADLVRFDPLECDSWRREQEERGKLRGSRAPH